jgi:hypothetical protein
MPKFRVEFVGTRQDEEIEADGYRELRSWIIFFDKTSVIEETELMRIQGKSIFRVERLQD